MYYYSQTTKGFYTKEIHGDNMPLDVIEITDEKHKYLLDEQSKGCIIEVINDEIILKPSTNHIWNGVDYVLDLDKVKEDKLQEIRDCRSSCWQEFDGLYNACERDLKQDDTNQVLIARLNACESLRACLKDIPVTAQTALDSAITLEDIEAISFNNCLTIPIEISEDVAEYFN